MQPEAGENIPQNGWVSVLYGPFTDGSGTATIGNSGKAYVQYGITEQPPTDCAGGIVNTALSLLETSALGMLTGDGPVAGVGDILKEAGTDIVTLALQCAGVSA